MAMISAAAVLSANPISVSEINYEDPDGNDYEFLELINISASTVSLNGARFTNGITFTFTGAGTLAPGERIVVASDPTRLAARAGGGIRFAPGSFSGRLADEGERLSLVGPDNTLWFQFTYRPTGDWPSRPAGLGSSLECVDPAGDLGDPENWRASAEWLGSPGRPGAGPQRVVVINEILAHTDPPLEDAIELLNLTDQPVNIGGWYLSNSRAKPDKYRIPANTVLAAFGRTVFYEFQFDPPNPPAGREAFRYNSSQGDEAVLLAANAGGTPTFWMDTLSFGATANGVSLGRHPEGTGRLAPMSRLTFGTEITAEFPPVFLDEFRKGKGATNAYPQVGPVVLRRIQYSPGPAGDEFIELQNASLQTVPLYDPIYPTNTWRIRNAIDFNFPANVSLAPGARVIVTAVTPEVFRSRQIVPAGVEVYGPWTNALNNAGERVALFKPDPPQGPDQGDAGFVPYVLVEEVEYSPNAPWPAGTNGTGVALRRRDLAAYADDPAAWEADVDTAPTAPVLTVAQLETTLRLSFESETGRTYRLEGRDSLSTDPWTDLGLIPIPPSGGPVTVDVPLTGTTRLLRVVIP